MLTWRIAGALFSVALLNFTTCRSPGEAGRGPSASSEPAASVDLPGIDTSSMTAREKHEWSGYVSELLAPCPDQPVSIAQCVREKRACNMCLPAAKFLEQRVQRGNARSQIEAAFRTRFAPDQVKHIELDDSPAKGPVDAPVTIVEWADFECPFCGRAAPLLDKIFAEYPGKIHFVYKNYPLSIHEHSEIAARAAMAARKQGKFWQMHDALFKNQATGLDKATILRLAQQVGLNMKQFQADWDSESVADAVLRDRKQGDKLGLDGTPLIYIDGRHFNLDEFDIGQDLESWVKLEVQIKTGKAVEPAPVPTTDAASAPAKPGASAHAIVPKPAGATSKK
jgi:protein-disulfide isomerase